MLKHAEEKPADPPIQFYVGSNIPLTMRLESIPEENPASKKHKQGTKNSSTVTFYEPLVTQVHQEDIPEYPHHHFYYAIPKMPVPIAIVCCILNIVLPGVGKYSIWIHSYSFFHIDMISALQYKYVSFEKLIQSEYKVSPIWMAPNFVNGPWSVVIINISV